MRENLEAAGSEHICDAGINRKKSFFFSYSPTPPTSLHPPLLPPPSLFHNEFFFFFLVFLSMRLFSRSANVSLSDNHAQDGWSSCALIAQPGGNSQLPNAAADITHAMQIGYCPYYQKPRSGNLRKHLFSFKINSLQSLKKVSYCETSSDHQTCFGFFVYSLLICLFSCVSHFELPLCLPVIFSCLGIIPCKGADKQSSSCGDT